MSTELKDIAVYFATVMAEGVIGNSAYDFIKAKIVPLISGDVRERTHEQMAVAIAKALKDDPLLYAEARKIRDVHKYTKTIGKMKRVYYSELFQLKNASNALIPDQRKQFIEALASSILHKHSVNAPPTPVIDIVTLEGLRVQYVEMTSNHEVGAATVVKGKHKTTIYVNKDCSEQDINFAIAHEYGHHLLHKDEIEHNTKLLLQAERGKRYGTIRMKDASGREIAYKTGELYLRMEMSGESLRVKRSVVEAEADYFALQFTVPRDSLAKYYLKSPSIELLASIFSVRQGILARQLRVVCSLESEI